MIAIATWLFIVLFFGIYTLGFFTACILGSHRICEAEMSEAKAKRKFELERDSNNGTQKRYIELVQKVKDAEHIGYMRGMDRAQEITDKVFKVAK